MFDILSSYIFYLKHLSNTLEIVLAKELVPVTNLVQVQYYGLDFYVPKICKTLPSYRKEPHETRLNAESS